MSVTPNLGPPNTSETEGRPVLRPAGNTTTVLRKALTPTSKPALAKGTLPSLKGTSPKLLRPPSPNFRDKELSETLHNALSEGQCEDGKRSESRMLEERRNLGSKRTSLGGKSVTGRGNPTTKSPSMGTFRSPTITAARSPWSSIGSSSSEDVSIVPSNGCSDVKWVDLSCKAAGRGRRQASPKVGRVVPDGLLPTMVPPVEVKKRCGWITSQSDAAYVAYHDTEWGVPVRDDRKLFELLVLVGAQAELPWPVILSKREMFRTAFAGFDPAMVAKFGEKKIASLKADNNIIQHEGKIRGIIDNASRVLEIEEEFGSFEKYLWGFVNNKPMVSKYRHPKQVPVKTPKSELMSKDLLKRGFRFVGPTVMYSFMQAMGMSNDHLVTCYRYKECSSDKALEPQEANKSTMEQTREEIPKEDEEIFSLAALYTD